MIFYYSNPYIDGECLEDITGEDYTEALAVSVSMFSGPDAEVIYVGF